jgi:hypothetical protein
MEDVDDDDDIDESCSSADHSFSSRHRVRRLARFQPGVNKTIMMCYTVCTAWCNSQV